MRSKLFGHFVLALLCAPLLMGSACEKKSAIDPAAGNNGSQIASDDPETKPVGGPVDTTPLPGIDTSKMDPDQTQLFYDLLGSLSSPCGKAHSLRTSFTTDSANCKRAPYAVRYLQMLVGDGAPADIARKDWEAMYKTKDQPVKFDTSHAPHEGGGDDAPVKFVEFYDYGCPHCKAFKPMMDQVLKDEGGKATTYFLMFPLDGVRGHENSRSAAQAALAAAQQGKFAEMHDMLFDKAPDHAHDAVSGYAKELGLDMAKFEAAYAAAMPQVDSDKKQGDDAGVNATPTIYINGRKYDGPLGVKYLEAWIEEELAVGHG